MRIINLILSDFKLLFKYGFLFIYLILGIVYIMILNVVPLEIKEKIEPLIILFDPMTLGLFLVGAWILLEKNQNILKFLLISPVSQKEYLLSKALSMSFLGAVVSFIILFICKAENIALSIVFVFWGGFICTLIGIMIGTISSNITQYVIFSLPFEIWVYFPIVLGVLGRESWALEIFPGYVIWEILNGDLSNFFMRTFVMLIWTVILIIVTYRLFKKLMYKNI